MNWCLRRAANGHPVSDKTTADSLQHSEKWRRVFTTPASERAITLQPLFSQMLTYRTNRVMSVFTMSCSSAKL